MSYPTATAANREAQLRGLYAANTYTLKTWIVKSAPSAVSLCILYMLFFKQSSKSDSLRRPQKVHPAKADSRRRGRSGRSSSHWYLILTKPCRCEGCIRSGNVR